MKKSKKGLFQQVPVLNKKECERAVEGVLRLQSEWIKLERKGSLKNRRCFRLGSSLEYSTVDQKLYMERARAINPIMKEEFGWLYKLVTKALSKELGKPVRLRDEISYPGFHIVMNDAVFGKYSPPWHVDIDAVYIKWKDSFKFSEIKAITIPISLPPGGGTLDIKDLEFNDVFGKPKPVKETMVRGAKLLGRFPHKLGQAFIMNTNRYHRIGLLKPPFNGKDMRITLQGYLIPQKGHWVIHW